jgi:hypothetical protein
MAADFHLRSSHGCELCSAQKDIGNSGCCAEGCWQQWLLRRRMLATVAAAQKDAGNSRCCAEGCWQKWLLRRRMLATVAAAQKDTGKSGCCAEGCWQQSLLRRKMLAKQLLLRTTKFATEWIFGTERCAES